MNSHSISSPLISATQLNDILDNPDVKIFDVRGKWGGKQKQAFDDYTQGHIPGAVFLDWMTHFITPGIEVNLAPVSSQSDATRSFQDLGISDGDTVVLYDDYHHMLAGRIWWAMRFRGFDNVKILDGGLGHWVKNGYAKSTTMTTPDKGSFIARENPDLETSLDTLIATRDDINLIDGRGEQGYLGKPDDDMSGHIPGAINVSFRDVLDEESGVFKSDSELTALFSRRLPDFKHRPVVSSCGAGYAGTIILVALRKLGMDAPLFDGSFALWKSDPERPVEQG